MSTINLYITKYALTDGIRLIPCKFSIPHDDIAEDMREGPPMYYHGEGKDWHRTLEGAKKRAYEMRDAKINSLEKSLKKMKALHFESVQP